MIVLYEYLATEAVSEDVTFFIPADKKNKKK